MRKSPLLWLVGKMKKRIPGLLLMTAANVGNALFSVWFALGTRQVINTAVGGDRTAFLQACGIQAGIILGILATLFLQRYLNMRLGADLDRDWKRDLLHKLLHGDYPAVSAYHSGELINRLNNDVRTVDEGVLSILPGLASMVTRIAGAAAALLMLEPLFGAGLIVSGAVLVLFTALARKKLKVLHKQVSEAEGHVSGLLQETLEKLLLVQAMDLPDEMERRADAAMGIRYALQTKRRRVSLAANTGVSIVYYLAGFAALLWCSAGLLQSQITFGDLTAVTQLVSQLQAPFVNLSGVIPKYTAMIAAAERLMELDALGNGRDDENALPEGAYEAMTAIAGENICFAYGREDVLSGVTFSLKKNSFTAITAPSGRGKSTLLKLMLGIYRPDSGELYLQTPEGRYPLSRNTRHLFAYVPQGNLLFSGTVRENLLVANPDADENAVQEAVFVSAMDGYLQQLPQGLDTVLGESGAGLSEGQAQRLAIARAVLGGAPVLLLDEATSALDPDTELLVLRRLRSLKDRTCLAVTHRPAALALADSHIKLDLSEVCPTPVETVQPREVF